MPQTTQFTIPMRVLVFEEQSHIRDELAGCLEQHGIEATMVATAEQALWELRVGRYAVLVLDVGDDVAQALALLEDVRNSSSRVQIILHTKHKGRGFAR